jgi:hypothetical protein
MRRRRRWTRFVVVRVWRVHVPLCQGALWICSHANSSELSRDPRSRLRVNSTRWMVPQVHGKVIVCGVPTSGKVILGCPNSSFGGVAPMVI